MNSSNASPAWKLERVAAVVFITLGIGCFSSLAADAAVTDAPVVRFFDDFAYADSSAMQQAGNFVDYAYQFWSPDHCCEAGGGHCVSFSSDGADNYMALRATRHDCRTGRPDRTARVQSSFYVGPEGVFAARVRFNSGGIANPATGEVVHGLGDVNDQDFYGICRDYGKDSYSEVDMEYLSPNGWPSGKNKFEPGGLWLNSWKKKWCEQENPMFQQCPQPPRHDMPCLDNAWVTLGFQMLPPDPAGRRTVRFFTACPACPTGNLYPGFDAACGPDSPMRIEFSNWFSEGAENVHAFDRTYTMDVDWVFYSNDRRFVESEDVLLEVRDEVDRIRETDKGASCVVEGIVRELPEHWAPEPVGECQKE